MIIDSSVKGRVIKARGFNDDEYEAIKKSLKDELSFRVTIRRWKRNYAFNQIDIRPYGKGVYKWTETEFEDVYKFMLKHNLYTSMLLDDTKASKYSLFNNGFNFVSIISDLVITKDLEIEEPVQNNVVNLNEYRKRKRA